MFAPIQIFVGVGPRVMVVPTTIWQEINNGQAEVAIAGAVVMIALAGIAQINYLRRGSSAVKLDLSQRYGELQWPLYLPYLCAGLAFAMLIYSYGNSMPVPFSLLSLCVGSIIALVLARQVLVLRENAALYKKAQEEIAAKVPYLFLWTDTTYDAVCSAVTTIDGPLDLAGPMWWAQLSQMVVVANP